MSAPSRSPSRGRSRSRSRRDLEEGDCVVQVVGAFSDKILCALQLPRAGTVLDVKRRVQASQGINVFRQRLVISPAGREAEDHEILASLPGLRLQLIKLEYADDDDDRAGELMTAAEEGAAPKVERLLRLPLRPDGFQELATPLILASAQGHLEVAKLLCEAGADKDKVGAYEDIEDRYVSTPLIFASARGHLDVAQLLCEAGADKDKANDDGYTALTCASYNRHLEVARLLCEAGANKDKADHDGCTALMGASRQGHLEVARLLCEAGADKDKADGEGYTALMRASGNGHLEVARLLCEAGADKDKADQEGVTALMDASGNGHLDVARLLREAGADNAKRRRLWGKQPLPEAPEGL